MLFDAHTHINSDMLTEEDRKALIDEIEKSPVSYVVDIGCELVTSKMAVDHARNIAWCYATVGYHPHDAGSFSDIELMMIETLAKKDKVVAIGEIGLDYHYDNSPRDVQQEVFRKQIQLANRLKMPIVVHSRDADQETMDILKEEGAFTEERKSWFEPKLTGEPDARVLIHCFSGSKELAEQYTALGATISISGTVTYKSNKKTRRVVEAIPLDYILVETDAPYLTPEPHRGERNKAPFVEFVARKVAEIKGISYEEVAEVTMANAKHFYGIE